MLTLKDVEERVTELLRERDRQEQRPKPLSSMPTRGLLEKAKFLWGDAELLDSIAGKASMELDNWYKDLAKFEEELRDRVRERLSAIYSPEVVSAVLATQEPYEVFWFAVVDMWEVYEEVEILVLGKIIDRLNDEEGGTGE